MILALRRKTLWSATTERKAFDSGPGSSRRVIRVANETIKRKIDRMRADGKKRINKRNEAKGENYSVSEPRWLTVPSAFSRLKLKVITRTAVRDDEQS